VFFLGWVVTAQPVIVKLTGFYQGISPAISHSGFNKLVLGGRTQVSAGYNFHHLHHKHFEVKYGNTPSPADKLSGSWRDGTPEAHAALQRRRLARHRRS